MNSRSSSSIGDGAGDKAARLSSSMSKRTVASASSARNSAPPAGYGRRIFIRVANERNIVTIRHSPDGRTWTKFGTQMEVSGYNHNTAWDFLSLRPALYVAGPGEARFDSFKYRALA